MCVCFGVDATAPPIYVCVCVCVCACVHVCVCVGGGYHVPSLGTTPRTRSQKHTR
jgi:hypothetical protein